MGRLCGARLPPGPSLPRHAICARLLRDARLAPPTLPGPAADVRLRWSPRVRSVSGGSRDAAGCVGRGRRGRSTAGSRVIDANSFLQRCCRDLPRGNGGRGWRRDHGAQLNSRSLSWCARRGPRAGSGRGASDRQSGHGAHSGTRIPLPVPHVPSFRTDADTRGACLQLTGEASAAASSARGADAGGGGSSGARRSCQDLNAAAFAAANGAEVDVEELLDSVINLDDDSLQSLLEGKTQVGHVGIARREPRCSPPSPPLLQ